VHRAEGRTQVTEGQQRDDSAPEMPFDFYLDVWNPLAAQFQATGEVVLVRLPFGFYGGIVIGSAIPEPSWRNDPSRPLR